MLSAARRTSALAEAVHWAGTGTTEGTGVEPGAAVVMGTAVVVVAGG